MTYKDVYKKFMIEYDKADISSSYPSLTIYEVATLLDKAMLALIAQKVTGNNPRRQTLDLDMKGISDLQTLIRRKEATNFNKDNDYSNKYSCDIIDTGDIGTPYRYLGLKGQRQFVSETIINFIERKKKDGI